MTTSTLENVTPAHYAHLISDKGREVLAANNLTVHIEPEQECARINNFPFASIFEQIPNPYEYDDGRANGQTYTLIKADEVSSDDDETVKKVLARLGCDLADTHYWKAYAYELAAPNKKGLTKLLTINKDDIPEDAVNVNFAGFGYRSIKKVDRNPESFAAWELEENGRLTNCLYPVSLWLNDKMMTVTVRDGDDGMYITEYNCGSDIPKVDRRLIATGEKWANSYRSGSEYPRKKAEHKAATHILPTGLDDLLSDETLALLADEGLRVEVTELPRARDINVYLCDKLFVVKELYPQFDDSKGSDGRIVAMTQEDFGATLEDTANKLMASMGGDSSTMSYWAVYRYETDVPNQWGHTVIYTTDINDFEPSCGALAGISITYNLYMTPVRPNEPKWQTRQRVECKNLWASYTPEQRQSELLGWQSRQLESLNNSLFNMECLVNKKLLEVHFYHVQNSDWLVSISGELYQKDAELFNAKIQAVMADRKDKQDNYQVHLKEYLLSINAA